MPHRALKDVRVDETLIRLGIFIGALLLFSGLEAVFPKKARTQLRQSRWMTHIGLTIINTVAVRLLGPIVALAVAGWAALNNIGLFNLTDWPDWFEIALSFILLDFAIYLQHIATHKIPILWRIHKVHHSDLDLDASSALRFHPIEIMLSMIYKCGLALLIGPAIIAVLIFEICLNASAIFNHANLALPNWCDRFLRLFIVTPDMHRVHHSIIPNETDRNFGFNFSIWDRVFRTYCAQPKAGHDKMTIGLSEHQTSEPTGLIWSLKLPFAKTGK